MLHMPAPNHWSIKALIQKTTCPILYTLCVGEEQPNDKPKSYAAAVVESISDVEPSSTTESNEESTASASGRTGSTEVEVVEAHALGSSVMSGTSSYWWDSPVSSQLSSPGDGETAGGLPQDLRVSL
jgi:hypothetical protein